MTTFASQVKLPALISLLITLLFLTSSCSSFSVSQAETPTPGPTLVPTATLPPTPIPATNTPEPAPTREPTPTPLPRFFTEQFNSSLAGWVILQAGNPGIPNITTEDGTLRFQIDSPYAWLYSLYGAENYADVYVEAEYVHSGLSPAAAGLVCRYSEADGWLEYNVLTDGTYNVLYGRWLDTGIADYLPIIDGTSREVAQSGATQQIGLTCSGTIIQLYINGTLIRNVDVSSYKPGEGRVGITASSFENTPVIAVFDWVTVGEP